MHVPKTWSRHGKQRDPIFSHHLPLSLSPKVTYPTVFLVRKANLNSSSIMCLEYPLFENYLSFFKPYEHNSSRFRYPYILGPWGLVTLEFSIQIFLTFEIEAFWGSFLTKQVILMCLSLLQKLQAMGGLKLVVFFMK